MKFPMCEGSGSVVVDSLFIVARILWGFYVWSLFCYSVLYYAPNFGKLKRHIDLGMCGHPSVCPTIRASVQNLR